MATIKRLRTEVGVDSAGSARDRSGTGVEPERDRSGTGPLIAATALLVILFASPTRAQTAENVLVVSNDASATSIRIADYYASKRGIPGDQVLRLKMPLGEQVTRAEYASAIESPIAKWFARTAAYDRILYIVLTKGVPLRIEGTAGRDGTTASVDSELTLLYRRITGRPVKIAGPVNNPYFLAGAPPAQAMRFTHAQHDIFLVTRLDGFSEGDVLALVDRGLKPSKEGTILLDQKSSFKDAGNNWLKTAADRLDAMGFGDRVMLESTGKVLSGQTNVLGYYSWGSNDPAIRIRRFEFQFENGAIAGMFVSTDGRTFQEPPADWKITDWSDRKTYFADSPQSLAGDLIREGVTGISAHVAEPYLDATIRPDVLFPVYLRGLNLAESYYLAMPYLSWQTVVIGDPLCAPFDQSPREAMTSGRIVPGVDPITELPAFFSNRRVDVLSQESSTQPSLNRESLRYFVKAEARRTRGDDEGEQSALERALAIEPRLQAARMGLALIYERKQDFKKAAVLYREALSALPNNAIVLNNLAYLVAVHERDPATALPLAQRAYAALPKNAAIMDTLGWIQHLLNNEGAATSYLTDAVRAAPNTAEFRFHLASVLAARADYGAADEHLQRALSLAPDLAEREDVKRLQAAMKGRK